MSEIIFEVREDETDGGFVARALGHSIVTQADTWEELRNNVRDAVRCHFEEGQAPQASTLNPPHNPSGTKSAKTTTSGIVESWFSWRR